MELEFAEISNEEFNSGGGYKKNIAELDNLRANFPKELGEVKEVIYKVISNKTNHYDDLVVKAIKTLKEDFNIDTTYQNIRYLVLTELTNNHRSSVEHLFSNFGKQLAKGYMRYFSNILKRNNIGNDIMSAYYTIKVGASLSNQTIKRKINKLNLRKPYSIPLVTPNLLLHNLIYIMDEKKDNTKQVEDFSEELEFEIDDE